MALLFTILGIGFVLFVHELGHFMAARAAGMRVEVFALGFGPRIWGFRRGGTDYRLALLPLGGYVLVAGESGTGPPRRGELMAVGPAWRILFFSGGILMNLAFALVLLPILFAIGVPFESPVIGSVEPGSTAWHAGLRSGDRMLDVDGRAILGFRHIATAVALAPEDEPVHLRIDRDGAVQELTVTTEFDSALGFRRIGVGPQYAVAPIPGGAAARAGLRDDDVVLAIRGLPLNGVLATQLALEDAALAEGPVTLRVRRDGAELDLQIEPDPPDPASPAQLGVSEQQNRVVTARGELASYLLPGDILRAAGGEPVHRPADLLRVALRSGGLPKLEVLRDGASLTLPALPHVTPDRLSELLHLDTGPGLRLAVRPGSAAELAGLRDEHAVLRVDDVAVRDFAELRRAISDRVSSAATPPPIELTLMVMLPGAADPQRLRVTLAPLPARDLGLGLRPVQGVVRSANPLRAVALGAREAWETVLEVALTLKRIFVGEISATNLGGIISIGQVTHSFASQGLIPLLLFLCVISLNLAVLNVLPLPALDGGHILLVLIEMMRGKPVGLRARNAFNLVGFAFVIGLLLFVTTLDLRRLLN
jgi:regulator of sigma E protease